jgi:hypothetical protein
VTFEYLLQDYHLPNAMPLDFYYTITSPPCRSVLLLAKTLGLELNLKKLDLLKGEHRTAEFLEVSGALYKPQGRGFDSR